VAGLLHDQIQQLLAGAMMLVRNLDRREPQLGVGLEEIDAILRESMEASRSLAREISPPVLRNGGLVRALEEICARFEHQHGLICTLEAPDRSPRLHDALEAFLYHAVGELLLNVVKHASATRVQINMAASSEEMQIAVEDDGTGFACVSDLVDDDGGHYGLQSIRQRLELFDGTLRLQNAPTGGASAVMILPLTRGNVPRGAGEPVAARPAIERIERAAGRRLVRLLIADDHEMIRKGLRSMLAREPQIEIVGEARDGLEAVRLARELEADVVLMDLSMPGADGLEATREILAAQPTVQVVAMSASSEETVIGAVLEAGATGFLSKTCSFEQLIAAIRTAGQT
jgi:CheY-like chemotaxis protein